MTDNDGLTDTDSVSITVDAPPHAPTASLAATPTSGEAPVTVTLTYSGEDSDGSIEEYQIDFEGDGVYDFSSTEPGQTDHTYGEAGEYTPTLKVMDSAGLIATKSVAITVDEPATPMVTDAEASPIEGPLPLKVTLKGSAVGGSGSYVLYVWDFDGDGQWDSSSSSSAETTHTYTEVGSFSPTLKIVDSNGLSDTDSCSITVKSPDQLKVWVSVPKSGAVIWGEAVSLRANTAPGARTQHVRFQYKGMADADWSNIGGWITPPPYSFSAQWDVTGLEGGFYSLRALALDTDDVEVQSDSILVRVSPPASSEDDGEGASQSPAPELDVEEGYDEDGNPHKRARVKRNETQDIYANDNTCVTIPFGAVSEDTSINITTLKDNPHNTRGAGAGLKGVTRITLENEAKLNKPVMLTIAYEDEDDDGYVDGTDIPEIEMRVYWFNETTEEWESIGDCSVDTRANTVRAKVIHFTDFAVASANAAPKEEIVEEEPQDPAPVVEIVEQEVFEEQVVEPEETRPVVPTVAATEQNTSAGNGGGGGGCFITSANPQRPALR